MMNLKLEKPRSDAPGFMKRHENIIRLHKYLVAPDLETDFFALLREAALPFIVEPVNRDEAFQALMELSEDDYREVLRFVRRGGNEPIADGEENPTVPEPSETS